MFSFFGERGGRVLGPLGLAGLLSVAMAWSTPGFGAPAPGKSGKGTPAEFLVYDSTSFSRKPNLAGYGFPAINIIYSGELWQQGESRDQPPGHDRLFLLGKKVGQDFSPTVIDIEHWPIQRATKAEIQASVQKYLAVMDGLRKGAPNTRFGYYGMVPIRDYWRAIKGPADPEYKQWQAENDALQALADSVDILFPSIYTFYTDRKGWETYAIEQIREARLLAKGKPVYAFLWPNYHDSNKLLGGSPLPADFWQFELETMKRHADGVVIWDGATTPWQDDSSWWQVTKSFLRNTQ